MKFISLLSLCILFVYSCSTEDQQNTKFPDNPIDSFESAIPDGKQLPMQELSDEDRIKLAKASGKQAETLPFDTLISLINDTNDLIVFNFWNLDCHSCKVNIDIFEKLRHESEEAPNFQVIHINTDNLYPDMLNSYIREKAILDPVYTIDTDKVPNWKSLIHVGWDGQVPSVLIVNNEDGTRLFYEKQFTMDEFQTILLPLTL